MVSYEENETIYQSVIAKGQPVEIRQENVNPECVTQFGETSRPLFKMWQLPRANLDIRLFELQPEELTGRCIDTEKHEE